MSLRTAVIGVGHLGRQHARLHAALASQGRLELVSVCDAEEQRAREIASRYEADWTTDWESLVGRVDAVSLAVPTELHCGIASSLLERGIHVLVEKPIARSLDEADCMISAADRGRSLLQVGHLERFNPALVALRPYVSGPLYFEIHRVGQFTTRSLDIDVVLDLMIHDLDIVQWLVGKDVPVTDVRAVGIPVLTDRVDAANARIEFASGAVANITASRVGTERIRKMRFFQPHDYVAVDYTERRASISSLAPPGVTGLWPGVNVRHLEVSDVEPLRAEIQAFVDAAESEHSSSPVSGAEGRGALELALRALECIHEHAGRAGIGAPVTAE